MRLSFALVLLLPSVSFAQTDEMVKAVERDQAAKRTAKWVLGCEAPGGGFYLAPQDPKDDAKTQPSLRATNGAVRALKYLGFPLLKGEREKHAAFVLKCYDPKTGAFAEPGGKPDVATTSIGVMVAMELGVPKEKIAKAMDYLKENAKTFEEVRIGAAAVEAWGVKDCPFKVSDWFEIAKADFPRMVPHMNDGGARAIGSIAAFVRRLNLQKDNDAKPAAVAKLMDDGQLADGGWNRQGAKAADIESTYRVMRAFMLLGEKPKGAAKLREFIAAHRNNDDGYATKPGDKSSMSGVYYCVIVSKWLDDLEAKK